MTSQLRHTSHHHLRPSKKSTYCMQTEISWKWIEGKHHFKIMLRHFNSLQRYSQQKMPDNPTWGRHVRFLSYSYITSFDIKDLKNCLGILGDESELNNPSLRIHGWSDRLQSRTRTHLHNTKPHRTILSKMLSRNHNILEEFVLTNIIEESVFLTLLHPARLRYSFQCSFIINITTVCR